MIGLESTSQTRLMQRGNFCRARTLRLYSQPGCFNGWVPSLQMFPDLYCDVVASSNYNGLWMKGLLGFSTAQAFTDLFVVAKDHLFQPRQQMCMPFCLECGTCLEYIKQHVKQNVSDTSDRLHQPDRVWGGDHKGREPHPCCPFHHLRKASNVKTEITSWPLHIMRTLCTFSCIKPPYGYTSI